MKSNGSLVRCGDINLAVREGDTMLELVDAAGATHSNFSAGDTARGATETPTGADR